MRRRTLLMTTALLLAPPAAGLAFVACGGDDVGAQPSNDGGPRSDATADHQTGDAQPTDGMTGGDVDAGPSMHFVALNGLMPVQSNVRYCFAATATGDPGVADAVDMVPQPAAPGLAPGRLSNIHVPPSIAGKNVRVFVYYTASLDAFGLEDATCPQLLATSRLSPVGGAGGGGGGDTGAADTGAADTGAADAGAADAGASGTEAGDTGAAGDAEAGVAEASATDAHATDAGAMDATATDAAAMDAGAMEADATDAGTADAGSPPLGDGGAVLVQTLDFDVSETIPGSMLNATAPYLLFATGCPMSSNVQDEPIYCGLPVDAGGNGVFLGDFHVYALQLDDSAPPSGKVNVQGFDGTQLNLYYANQVPAAYDFGVTYGDAGFPEGGIHNVVDASAAGIVLLEGPVNGGGDHPFPVTMGNGPLAPPTAIPPLSQASDLVQIATSWAPEGGVPFGSPGISFYDPIAPILELSNLTPTDLASGTTFTLVLLGDGTLKQTMADGGPNPRAWNFRIIRNDTP